MSTPPFELNPPIVGSSAAMGRVTAQIRRFADVSAGVLIFGESGCGKELVARNLHWCSSRRARPFVAVNCAALNPGVLESELFGHGRGAFTGAVEAHAGLFEQAHGGTLFLDEIGDVPFHLQAKLLRVLQDREVRRMGSGEVRRLDVRVVSATNARLEQRVADGEFRLDLFYRLAVLELDVPPLRERADDCPLLIEHFFRRRGLRVPTITEDALERCSHYRWPGNVRELENELERIVALHPRIRRLTAGHFSNRVNGSIALKELDVSLLYDTPLPKAVGYLEENLLRKTLAQNNWNKSESARQLGLSRQGLLKKIRRYGISETQNGDSKAGGSRQV